PAMRITRRFTKPGASPYEGLVFRAGTSEIRNPDGSVVFRKENVMVPGGWSQVACDILAQKYFRRAGIPSVLVPVAESDVPDFLWRKTAATAALAELPAGERTRGE